MSEYEHSILRKLSSEYIAHIAKDPDSNRIVAAVALAHGSDISRTVLRLLFLLGFVGFYYFSVL